MALFGSKKALDKEIESLQAEKIHMQARLEKKINGLEEELKTQEEKLLSDFENRQQNLVDEKNKLEEELQKVTAAKETEIEQLKRSYEEKIVKIQNDRVEEITQVRKESIMQVQQMLEYIETRKEKLEEKTEKDLLVDTLFALEGYAGRLERLEKNMEYHEMNQRIDQMKQEFTKHLDETKAEIDEKLEATELKEKLDKANESVINKISESKKQIDEQLKRQAAVISNEIDSINNALVSQIDKLKLPERINELGQRIDIFSKKLSAEISRLEDVISSQIAQYDLPQKIASVYDIVIEIKNEVGVLDSIGDDVEVIKRSVGNEYSDYYSINEKIESISSEIEKAISAINDFSNSYTLNEMSSDIQEIKSNICYSYGYDSIPSKLESIERLVNDAKDAAESAKNAAERNSDY